MEKNYLVRYRVETDLEDKGEYLSLEQAQKKAAPYDYIIEVIYREIRSRIIKEAVPQIDPEVKKSNWLVLGGENSKRFSIDLDSFPLSKEEEKDPFSHREEIYSRYNDYMPFSLVEDIKSLSIQRKKFGVRLVGDFDHTTQWVLCNTLKDAKLYLRKTYKIELSK